MITIEEVPVERIADFWEIHYEYLVNDGIIDDVEDLAYFQGEEYRGAILAHCLRQPDKHLLAYFLRDGERIGAVSFCTYQSEDGKCFILDFWIFPQFRRCGLGHQCFDALVAYTRADGARYYEINCDGRADRMHFWKSIGFRDNGKDEFDVPLLIKR